MGRKIGARGAGHVEYAMLTGLIAVVTIPAVVAMSGKITTTFGLAGGTVETYASAALSGEVAELLDTNPCVEGTANDDVFGMETKDMKKVCFKTYGGNDSIGLYRSISFEIHPGAGDDTVYSQGRDDLIYYESGNDTYQDFQGVNSIIFPEDILSTDVTYLGQNRTANPGIAENMIIGTPKGQILIREQFITTHGFSYLVFPDRTVGQDELPGLVTGAQETSGSDTVWGTAKPDVFYPGTGDDIVYGGDGLDHFHYSGGNDLYSGGWQRDVLHIPFTKAETSPYMTGNRADLVIGMPGGGKVTMESQYNVVDISNPQDVNIQTFVFSDGETVDFEEMRLYTIERMQTPGNDQIFTGAADDVIRPGAGNDWVQAGAGDDLIIYESGDLYIKKGKGEDILDLSAYALADLSWSYATKDGYIDLPDGARISLEKVMETTAGKGDNAIERIILAGGVELDESEIMAHLLSGS